MRSAVAHRLAAPAATLLALAATAALVAGCLGRAEAASPPPGASPGATPAPIATPSPQPSGPTGGLFEVDLDVASPRDVSVLIKDESGVITGALSGRAGDGMSVPWNQIRVENADSDTLRVTWVGLPGDDEVRVVASGGPEDLRVVVTHLSPPENGDATGHDRVLLLDLAQDVPADTVTATLRSGNDT